MRVFLAWKGMKQQIGSENLWTDQYFFHEQNPKQKVLKYWKWQ